MFESEHLLEIENKFSKKYSKLSKIFLVITILFIVWIAVIILGIIFEFGPTWTLLTLDSWIYALSTLIAIFVILDLIFYLHFITLQKKRFQKEKPKPIFHEGKRLYIYTHPKGAEGGIFSKTYVKIDENSILRIRTLMIPPNELWIKKENNKDI